MDIDLLSKMVKELILDDDRVVLPGLGSFVAEIVPSTFSDRGYTINPPYRRLFFRSKPDEGDKLVRFYAESNNVELEIAERIIRDFVSELKAVLHSKKTVVFPGLGRLRATKENNVFFVADEDLDIYPAGFGLEPISLKTHEETPQEVAEMVEGLKDIIDEPIDLAIEEDVIPTDWTEEEILPEPESVPVDETVSVAEPEPEPEPEPEFDHDPAPATDPVEYEIPVEIVEPAAVVEQMEEEKPVAEAVTEAAAEEAPVEAAEAETEATEVAEEEVVAEETVEEEQPKPETIPVTRPVPRRYVEQKKDEDDLLKVLKFVGITLAVAAALLIIYVVAMRVFPDFLNNLLYTSEELEIINFK